MVMTKDTTPTTTRTIPRIVCVERIMNTVIGIPTADVSFEDRQRLERVGFYSTLDLASYLVSESGFNSGDRNVRMEFGDQPGLIKHVDSRNAATELELVQTFFGVNTIGKPTVHSVSKITHICITLDHKKFPYVMQKEFGDPVNKAINSIIKGEVLLRNYTNKETMLTYTQGQKSGVRISANVHLSNGTLGYRDLVVEQSEYREIGERFLQVISEAYDDTLSRLQFDQTTDFDYSQVEEEGVLA